MRKLILGVCGIMVCGVALMGCGPKGDYTTNAEIRNKLHEDKIEQRIDSKEYNGTDAVMHEMERNDDSINHVIKDIEANHNVVKTFNLIEGNDLDTHRQEVKYAVKVLVSNYTELGVDACVNDKYTNREVDNAIYNILKDDTVNKEKKLLVAKIYNTMRILNFDNDDKKELDFQINNLAKDYR